MLEHQRKRKGRRLDNGEQVIGYLTLRPVSESISEWFIGFWNDSMTVWTECRVEPDSVKPIS